MHTKHVDIDMKVLPVPHSATVLAALEVMRNLAVPIIARACAGRGRRFNIAISGESGSSGLWRG